MNSRWCLGVAVAGWMALGAAAQPTNHVAWSKIDTAPWILNPVYTEAGGGTQPTIHSFLALADPGSVTGNNLVAVWYIKGSAGWTTKSWMTTDPWKAINSVKAELGIPDAEDERWGFPGDGSASGSSAPADYTSGVLATDPVAALILGSPDRDAIVQLLATVGYTVANVPVEKGGDCPVGDKLDNYATRVASMLGNDRDSSTTFVLGSDPASCFPVAGGPPITPRPPKPTSWPYWNPPGIMPEGGSPPGPGWVNGGWGAYSCRSVPLSGGGVNCICSRERQWGRWELRPCLMGVCQTWTEVTETEVCTNIVTGPCPAPPAGYACGATTPY